MKDGSKVVWTARHDPQVRRAWDALVVYHEPSGDVHVLSPVAEALLASLEKASRTTRELVEVARRSAAEGTLPDMESQAMALLEAMDEAGLIEKVLC